MEGNLNPRVIGACILGFALVAGAYLFSNFGQPRIAPQPATVIASESTPRVAIAVSDDDNNGLEDWRDEFIETEPIILEPITNTPTEPVPETLTGEFGINMVESSLLSQTYGPLGRSNEQIAQDAYEVLKRSAQDNLYDTPDITILRQWEDEDIATYANTIALAIINNDIENSEGEIFILHDILREDGQDRFDELQARRDAYKNMRDDTIATPVPAFLAKEHLDLINTYHAIYRDIDGMMVSDDDPVVTLMRMKRYEDDAAGLGFALTNMYNALLPYASLVGPEDPALLFVAFSPDFNS